MDNINLRKFDPDLLLRPYINSYWTGVFNRNRQDLFAQSVVPNGCMEIIIHLKDEHCFLATKDTWAKSSDFIIQGLHTQSYEVRFNNRVKVFGIRMHPDGFKNIFGIPPKEVTETFETGGDVLGPKFSEFCSRIRDIDCTRHQIALTNSFLVEQLAENHLEGDYSHIAMAEIRKSMGIGTYRNLLENVPISQRQLQRDFRKSYGITVRDYMRLLRVNAIHEYMANTSDPSLTQLTYHLNFTDQSHFIKEYRRYHGITPSRFRKLADHYLVNTI